MPKVVPDLEKRILDAAVLSFEKHGYKNVDIRSLANEAGVSVGSVYTRFKSKGDLFLKVAKGWLRGMVREIESRLTELTDDRQRLSVLVEILLTNIQKRGGLWREFFSDPDVRTQSESVDQAMRQMERLWKRFSAQLEELMVRAARSEEIKRLAKDYKGRLGLVFRGLIMGLAAVYPNQTKKNIEFARAFFEVIL